ncbi:protein kinase [bacterium]|nr:protein kinase [bacterium]
MSPTPGTRLGPYEIASLLGEGGMGEVYRATDTKLKRDVAIKVLPAAFTEDPERLARFEREAQLLAQLHHPNIASIFGLEESDGVRALVMELVEGATLADRLEQGRLSPDESLSIARQIAEALEEAHEKGIIHRDLKPQNVKAPVEGTVKVLDFGLAKAMDPAAGTASSTEDVARSPTLMQSPTLTAAHGTQMGMILGTAAYMAPEQARGSAVDKRADIWAFGVVLYEMLTGRSMFAADTVSDTLAGVLKTEIDFSKLPTSTPAAIRRLLRRCLERNPKNRLHDIADARIVIDEVLAGDAEEPAAAPVVARSKQGWLPWAIAATAVATAVVVLLVGGSGSTVAPEERLTRTSIFMPIAAKGDLRAGTFALSPDGGAIVLTASDEAGSLLYVRELAETEPRPLPGTDGAEHPFWSGDSQHIGFFAAGSLRRVPRGGGVVQTICPAKDGRGGAWNREGTILFTADFKDAPLFRVRASGGEPVAATKLDLEQGETSHRFPSFLPNGRHFLFGVEPDTTRNRRRIKLASLDEMSVGKPLLEASTVPRFASPNQLVFVRDAAVMVQSIDLARFEMVGEAQLLEERPSLAQLVTSTPIVRVADGGELLYAPLDPRPTAFVWLDRNGRRSDSAVREQGIFTFPAVSHGGNRVVVTKTENGSFVEGSLWIFDLDRGEGSQITARDQSAFSAIWSRDDRDLAATLSAQGVHFNQFAAVLIAAESGKSRELFEINSGWTMPTDVSADGRVLLYDNQVIGMKMNIGYLLLDGQSERGNYLATPAEELGARLSPDGRFIAYLSDLSGTNEAYVDTFPVPTSARRVTTGGAALDLDFRSDGKELFILAADGDRASLFASELRTDGELEIERPQKLFTLPVEWAGFAPSPKGDRFLMLERVGSRSPSLTLVHNWREQLGP